MWHPFKRRTPAARVSTKVIGSAGEDAAVELLCREGFRILERNYRCRLGEVDVIAREGDCLCFVEVKTRSSDRFGVPSEAVTARKREQILKTSRHYLASRDAADCDCRFDVVSVHVSPHGEHTADLTRDAFRE